MAFVATGFFRVASLGSVGTGKGSAKSLHSYHHPTDDAATVETAGYFNGFASQLAKGDIILAVLALDTAPVMKSYLVTNVSAGGVVTIAVGTL